MIHKINALKYLFFFSTLLFAFTNCTDISRNPTKNYSLLIMTQDANEYLIQTNSLKNGVINSVKDGILINQKEIGGDLIIKDGYYYYLNKKNGIFFKYALTAGKTFQKIDSVSLPNFYENNYSWI